MKISKKSKAAREKIDRMKAYALEDAIHLLKEITYAHFDETVDLAINLGVDPRHAEENIRVTTSLPSGTGKKVSVLVLARGLKEQEAKDAGADFVGNDDFIEKIQSGWTDVDKIIATPEMMPRLGKLGKILGPKGLMPNPKSGTVTMEIAKAVQEIKAGKVELRVEKNGIVHAVCGKTSFTADKLQKNIKAIHETIIKAKPASVKGTYLQKMILSSTMGPGIKLDLSSLH